ncbi:CBS domain-containing protein [Desulforamulus aquiferis]|uniref:CBS domain-containing protein n=1 Tax=Desulforamulus aquiferis TaxID=1397668 RepID=A0AAW7ZGE2_9FIRM|nr:CBS domain-containing protein [Desulforamulus aquiferis]MDO7788491.1 CBS domain-containing protein [Desulforamulus aquiferis]
MTAKDIMKANVITVDKETTISEIAKILTENKISGVPVVDGEGRIAGIVSEGDLLHKEISPRIPRFVELLGGVIYYSGLDQYKADIKKLAAIRAAEIMTEKVITVSKDTDIQTIASLMVKHNIKRIPVTEDHKIVGIVSRADIVKTLVL